VEATEAVLKESPDMRKVMTRLLLGLMFLGVCVGVVVWHHRPDTKRGQGIQKQRVMAINQEQAIEIQQREAIVKILAEQRKKQEIIARMASAHNAVTDWTDAFSGAKFAERLASQELAPVLVRKDGRPVLVFGSIVDVITQDGGCKLEVDAKANLVSNIRFWLSCTPAQVKEAMGHREGAHEEGLEEIRGEAGESGEEESTQEKQDDERQAERMARQGYAVIALVYAVHSEVAETNDDPPAEAQFTFAEGRCLDLLYVGRGYPFQAGDEAYLRLNTSEDERRARLEMKLRARMHMFAQEPDKKENH
jgi:hypothetical protein